jgi:hypothetical protein
VIVGVSVMVAVGEAVTVWDAVRSCGMAGRSVATDAISIRLAAGVSVFAAWSRVGIDAAVGREAVGWQAVKPAASQRIRYGCILRIDKANRGFQ